MTPQQRDALKQALEQHSLSMAVKDAAPEDVAALPQDFAIPTYNANNQPLYDNQLFPAVNSVEDLVARGYATPDGQVTENGQMALSLKKVGALNDDYTLNDTGKTLMASRDDLLKEENIDLYREYKRLELDEAPDVGIWDSIKDIASKTVQGANVIAQNELGGIKDIASSRVFGGAFDQYGAEALTPEKKAKSRIETEEAAKDLFATSAGLARAAATEIDKVAAKTMWDGMMQDYQVSYLEQKYDRDLADMEKVNTAEVADELAKVIGLKTQFAEGRQQAEQLIGPEATQQAIEGGRAAGLTLSLVNPLAPEALAARVGFGVAQKGVTAAFKPIARKLLESENKAAQALAANQRVNGLNSHLAQTQYLAKSAEDQAIFAERQADKLSNMGLVDRANAARTLADNLRTKGLEAGTRAQGLTDEIARASDEAAKLAQDAAVADKINFVAQKARELPGMPLQAIGGLIEGTGKAMIGIDKGLSTLASKIGADKAWNAMNRISSLSGLGGAGAAMGLGPAAFIPAAIRTAWSTAPFLKGAGNFVRMVGKETANARGQIPFWQRVANYENLGSTQRAVAHLMDTATIGGRLTGAAGDVAKGMAAAYPVDLAFQWISDGGEMDMNTLKQAAAETVVFGGGGALGGIVAGSPDRIKKLQRGDALNFYRNLKDGSQRVAFNALNDGMKRSIGTYASSFPNLNVRFTDQGGGAFDKATNTAFINPMARNPLKPLLAHEINHYILVRNQMEGGVAAALVGDGVQTGGILRGKDGKLDPNFQAFKDEYTRRLEAQHNRQIDTRIAAGEKVPARERAFAAPTDNDIAIEYFVDSMADDMMGMAESGELGKQAGRMLVTRKMQSLGNAILQQAPIIKDFFYKLGGATDKNGRAVYGNGLLAEGIREIPEMKKLFRKMISESAGRPMHVAKVTKGESDGHAIPIMGKDDPILNEMTSLWETDADGVPLRDKNGDYIPLSDQTEQLRASSGLMLLEDQQNRINRGETLEPGELRFNPEENAWTGEYLTDRQIQILRTSGRFNNAQLRQLDMLNGAAKENTGRRFLVFNQPATKKRKGKRVAYDTLGVSMREIVPYGIKITKDGNLLVRLMSVQQLHANAFEKAASKRGQSLYKGNAEQILNDVNQVIENHGRNEPTDAYFKSRYGNEWEVRKNFINTVFGNVGKGQKDINPLLAAEKAKNAVVKTYRIDRINKATELEGRTNLPYQNHLVKVNFMPEGEPILDENGEPKDLRYTPSYEDSQVRMPEAQRAMPEGVSPEDLNPVANAQEAQGRWSDGKRMFAINEMDEKLIPITSKAMLESYPADAIGWMEPEPQKSVALRTNQAQERPVNERQPTTIQTQPSGASVSGSEATGEGLRQQGGLSRGTEQLQPQGRPGDQSIPLAGLPATVTVPGIGKYTFGPNETARSIAAEYARSAGIDYNPPRTYAKVDTERAKRIADEYEKMAHNPNDPKVKESYDAMIKETLDQWEAIKKTGLKVEPIPAGSPDPYAASPRLALIDVKDNNHLWFFPTASGFGGTESAGIDISGNPLMQPTGEVINGHPMLANDVFRIVHDYFGHIKEGVGFRADGEENAWRSHSAMYSDKARPAMTAETRGQNSWVNFGPFAEFNKTATGADTQYAPQKTGLLPDWVMTEGASDARFMPEGDGSINLMKQTNLGGDASMIMSAKWGTPKQTSQSVALSDKPENHIVGLSRIKGLLKAKDLSDKQKSSLDDFLVKTASFATDSPGFRDLGIPTNKEEALTIISKVTDRMARNLLAIYDAVPPPIRSYWQRWYPLAYDWNQAQSAKHKITRQVVAGINARLSPGKDWIHNVNMTERILSAFADDILMTQEISDGAMPIIDNALETKLNSKENKNKPKAWIDEQKAKVNAAKQEVQNLVGMKLSEMTDAQAAQLIRYHTQVVGDNKVLNYFEQGNPVYADAISWQSFSNLEKAINMYRDPSMENISSNMGSDHKIRSFFNNQESPNDNVLRDVTSDTHAVAAAYLLPLSQSSQQVARNFGGSSNAVSGLNGMYYIVADAYRKAADARNVEPRAMQSITWEGARSMFPRGFKKAENVKKVEAIWNRFEKRELTKQQALQEINKLLIDFFAKNPNSRPRFAVLPR
jgi:hypothetical protein